MNYSVVDPDNARLWKRVVEITNTCQCIEAFRSRRLIDPQCAYHEFSLDIFEALRDERDRANLYKRGWLDQAARDAVEIVRLEKIIDDWKDGP